MFLKFQLFCWTLLVVSENIELEFEESTVFIYYQSVVDQFDLPDCLGTLIAANYVLTGASCFTKNIAFLHNFNIKNAIVVRVIPFITQGLLKLLWTVYSQGKLQFCLKLRIFQNPFNKVSQ